MGQRLVITVRKNDSDIATIYYHWSAYSVCALQETKDLVDYIEAHEIDKLKDIDDIQLELIKFCEANGGGISANDELYAKQKFEGIHKFKDDKLVSRNYGLIDISEKGMGNSQSWSEGDVVIDLDNATILNDVFFMCENFDELVEFCTDDEYTNIDEIPLYDCGDISNIRFDEIDETIASLLDAPYTFRDDNGNIYSLIV